MPISEQELHNPKNRFVAVTAAATVGQAISAWRDLGGEPWWHLIVRMDDGSYGAIRFSALYQTLQREPSADKLMVSSLNLTLVPAVEQETIEMPQAQALARKNAARVVVVISKGVPAGILVEGVRRGAGLMVSAASIDDLGGKYVKLKDYGSILLGPVKKPRS